MRGWRFGICTIYNLQVSTLFPVVSSGDDVGRGEAAHPEDNDEDEKGGYGCCLEQLLPPLPKSLSAALSSDDATADTDCGSGGGAVVVLGRE